MSLTKTQASCKCGASISTAFTSELTNWLGQHQQCLISQSKREWVGLTELEETGILLSSNTTYSAMKFTEAKLKEKNA